MYILHGYVQTNSRVVGSVTSYLFLSLSFSLFTHLRTMNPSRRRVRELIPSGRTTKGSLIENYLFTQVYEYYIYKIDFDPPSIIYKMLRIGRFRVPTL